MPVNQAGAWDKSGQLHVAIRAVHAFHSKHNVYPEEKDVAEV